ncbi:MAG: sugar ABC transporter permease [Clostridiales bacterium]|nr:sugar ABC transporter permease [Clostridiales bacterium]
MSRAVIKNEKRPFISRKSLPFYLMILIPVVLTLIYNYGPMFGLVMAFQNYNPAMGFLKSEWVGLLHFERMMDMPDIQEIIINTLRISIGKIVVTTLAAIVTALLLNEVRNSSLKRFVQTSIYFPYFLSWVILGGILKDILAREGLLNQFLGLFGMDPVILLGDAKRFPWLLIWSETWQQTGFNTIVYLAAISNINPNLYEAAAIDGAGRLRQTWHITLPGMSTTIILMAILSMGGILSAGLDQILMLYSPAVYSTADVIDTWVYRAGLRSAQYSLATAVGLLRSIVSFIMISLSYLIANKTMGYRLF